jgi:hypothetical protein
MSSFTTKPITHVVRGRADPISGKDRVPIDIPLEDDFIDVALVIDGAKGGSAQLYRRPSLGDQGPQTVTVSWTVAPMPGSFIKYHLWVDYQHWSENLGSVLLFQGRDFGKPMLRVDNYLVSLAPSGFNDNVSSIIVLNGHWVFYRDDAFKSPYTTAGNMQLVLSRGMYPYVGDVGIADDDLSSLRSIQLSM